MGAHPTHLTALWGKGPALSGGIEGSTRTGPEPVGGSRLAARRAGGWPVGGAGRAEIGLLVRVPARASAASSRAR
jgi:hypothetical protein